VVPFAKNIALPIRYDHTPKAYAKTISCKPLVMIETPPPDPSKQHHSSIHNRTKPHPACSSTENAEANVEFGAKPSSLMFASWTLFASHPFYFILSQLSRKIWAIQTGLNFLEAVS
jgi:hypothetical protein